ncbi:FAD binding domain-containing protein [Aspergillus crustosus]
MPTHKTPILIVGAGPAGLLAALQLATNKVPCILVERNHETTKWPKMDVTNVRSMEIFRRLGIDEGVRGVGVPGDYSLNVLFSTGLGEKGKLIGTWELPSPNTLRTKIQSTNDGSLPREPYQRCSQAIVEAWLKKHIQKNPYIKSIFGLRFNYLKETAEGVESYLITDEGEEYTIKSDYVVGCDGAGSKVRRSIGIPLVGGPVPGAMHLIHFKSLDLTRLHTQGQFWHLFLTNGSILISQNELDTWTLHRPIPLNADIDIDISSVDAKQAIYESLGGEFTAYKIEIDEILVTSIWRPTIAIAERYVSEHHRVFLAGDSAHQNIPTGGYGMNTAVGDSFAIGWMLAAVVVGYGGRYLLNAYGEERRPVGVRNLERSGVHWSVHAKYWEWCREEPGVVGGDSEEGGKLRKKIGEWVSVNRWENRDLGIEMGYRYRSGVVVLPLPDQEHENENENNAEAEPSADVHEYIPTTWPGSRAPHVFLRDGSSIYDHFGTGPQYTLVDFTPDARFVSTFQPAVEELKIPVKVVHLPDEDHCRRIWERDAVLIRPDDHVAWRASGTSAGSDVNDLQAKEVLEIAVGQKRAGVKGVQADLLKEGRAFSGTIGNVDTDEISGRAVFQQ